MALAKRGVVIIISKTIPTAEEAEIAGFHVVYIPLQPFRLLPVSRRPTVTNEPTRPLVQRVARCEWPAGETWGRASEWTAMPLRA